MTSLLIDCHVHVNNYDMAAPRSTEAIVADLFATMERMGVAHAVVLTSYLVNEHRPHIGRVIELLGTDPRISIVEGLRWRGDGERTDLYNMEERLRDGIVKGIKLYPGYENFDNNDPSLEAVFRIAAKYDVPVMIHCGDTYARRAKVRQAHPLLVDDVAVDYPDVKFVICHLGNPWFQDTAEVLYKNDNVYADISGLTLGDFEYEFERWMLTRVKDLIRYMGDPGKQLMYGTDWPLSGMVRYRQFLDNLELPAEQKEGIAWRTAAQLFRIDTSRLAAPSDGADRPPTERT
jgi:predicted TIM-barrel fold metal-dependent hydrolase